MIIQNLKIKHFRAHADTDLSFADGLNVIFGANGSGKTNLLEAIHFLALSKSFLVSKDHYALQHSRPFFELEGSFLEPGSASRKIRLAYVRSEGKKAFVNGVPVRSMSELVGQVPIVLFAPSDQALTAEGPDARRSFLNNVLSQSRPRYLSQVLHYRRVLKQRNGLLTAHRRRDIPAAVLESWTHELVKAGAEIISERARFCTEFDRYLERAYSSISDLGEKPTLNYRSVKGLRSDDSLVEITEKYLSHLDSVRNGEREQGRTLAGPHRDELIFRLNGFEVRRYASHGQHRSFGMSLQLAKYYYLEDKLERKPILMLDDIFGDLDRQRTEVFLEILKSPEIGQSLITTVDPRSFEHAVGSMNGSGRYIQVKRGGEATGSDVLHNSELM